MDSRFIDPAMVARTRADVDKRLSEIIENIIGNKRIKELFVNAGHPPTYKNQPTGMMALDSNVISQDTKTALLVAHAAECTLQLAEKGEDILRNYTSTKTERIDIDMKVVDIATAKHPDFKKWNHRDFKLIGSEGDPDLLKSAQATMMASQLFVNDAIRSVYSHYPFVWTELHAGDFADEFKKAAIEFYKDAADILKKEGHEDAANKLTKVTTYLNIPSPATKKKPDDPRVKARITTPTRFLKNRLLNNYGEAHENNTRLSPDYETMLKTLIELTKPIDATSASAIRVKPLTP